jgi:nitrous oxidase accessory protein NosD
MLFRLSIAALAAAALLPSPAAALECGASVSGHVVLEADLHCDSGWTALYVGAAGTVIDLNGYTISGTRALQGIGLHTAHDAIIRGPGTISGFWAGINGSRSNDVAVEDIVFTGLGDGVVLTHSERLAVRDNHFSHLDGHAVTVMSFAGIAEGSLGGHLIARNAVFDAAFGFQLCGQRNGNSQIIGNELARIRDYGIAIEDGAAHNTIDTNSMVDVELAAIRIAGSRNNIIRGNFVDRGWAGIQLYPTLRGQCDSGSARAEVSGNRVFDNTVSRQQVAVWIGFGSEGRASALRNRVQHNKLHDSDTGILFGADSARNDARFNAYQGTTAPVVDLGVGNRW